jgi:hypothetical protein
MLMHRHCAYSSNHFYVAARVLVEFFPLFCIANASVVGRPGYFVLSRYHYARSPGHFALSPGYWLGSVVIMCCQRIVGWTPPVVCIATLSLYVLFPSSCTANQLLVGLVEPFCVAKKSLIERYLSRFMLWIGTSRRPVPAGDFVPRHCKSPTIYYWLLLCIFSFYYA